MSMFNSKQVVADLVGEDGEPFVVGGGVVMSLWDGRLIPVVRGGDGDDGDDGSGDGDQNDDGGDDDDDGDDDAADVAARETRIRKAAEKSARRKLARKHGFSTVGEMDAWIEQNRAGADDGDDDGSDDDSGGDAGRSKGSRSNRRDSDVKVDAGPDLAQARSEVVLELASSGIDPARIKRATTLLMSDPDYLDFGDEIDSDDIQEAIDRLRKDEAGWFPDESDNSGGRGRGVPAGRRDRKGGAKQSPEEIARSYRKNMASAHSFKPPQVII